MTAADNLIIRTIKYFNLCILNMYKMAIKLLYKSINNYLTTNEICIFFAAGNLCLLVTHDNMMCMNCELFMALLSAYAHV